MRAAGAHPRILVILIKNISGLDYSVPLLWAVRRAVPGADLSVLYCTLSRGRILRRAAFHSHILQQSHVPEYDFADFLRPPYSICPGLWRRLFGASRRDSAGPIAARFRRLERPLEGAVDVARILPSFDPDLVLFDNRSVTAFPRRDALYDYFGRKRKPVFLLPHAPHHTGTTAFTPFDERGNPLPDYCEFWMPFRFDRSWERLPEKRDRFAYVGYPGLDTAWLDTLAARRAEDGPLRCLFIIRKFLAREQQRPAGHDAYVFDHDEFLRYVRLVAAALSRSDAEIELVVKPHPSNDFRRLRAVFERSGIPRWRITHEPIYAASPRCDLVVSLYSTTLLIPAMAGVPTVLLHSRIQDEIHQWPEMRRLYTGLRFYLEDPDELPDRFGEVVEAARKRRSRPDAPGPDTAHLREFYPDGAAARCMGRMGLDVP
jgi:hypothetical protein